MIRTLLYALGGVVLGGVIHLAVILGMPSLATTAAWDRVVSLGSLGAGAFATNITTLAGSNYWYTCFATNSAGSAWATPPRPFGALRIRYVDGGAAGSGTGYEWENAYSTIQAALDGTSDDHPDVLYLRGGVYVIASELSWVRSDVTVRGGYEGVGTPGAHDPQQ